MSRHSYKSNVAAGYANPGTVLTAKLIGMTRAVKGMLWLNKLLNVPTSAQISVHRHFLFAYVYIGRASSRQWCLDWALWHSILRLYKLAISMCSVLACFENFSLDQLLK